jgi:hypothetical protein
MSALGGWEGQLVIRHAQKGEGIYYQLSKLSIILHNGNEEYR